MTVKIVIPPYLQPYTNNLGIVEVNASSVGGCLSNLSKQFPEVEDKLFERNGELNGDVGIFVNRRDAESQGLAKPVQDGDELHILHIVGGG
ncbi:MAG: MoaD/ThiS family protein [Chloroflexi bacterium]|nr:MoaD/ThiS family protein [Chloroflexota bacterium]